MDDFDTLIAMRKPTPERPLTGMTVLVVEDSRFACEALRILCLRSGARIRRADCLRSARKHLRVYRPTVVVVDMGLPDGSGEELIQELAASGPHAPVILGTSGDTNCEQAAIAAGADGFISKPIENLATFQMAILVHLPPEMKVTAPHEVKPDIVQPDPIAYHDDLAQIAEKLSPVADEHTRKYAARFLTGIALGAHDRVLEKAARRLARGGDIDHLAGLVQERLAQKRAI